jgi:hypothetical protein
MVNCHSESHLQKDGYIEKIHIEQKMKIRIVKSVCFGREQGIDFMLSQLDIKSRDFLNQFIYQHICKVLS